jgi:hypothetical protein
VKNLLAACGTAVHTGLHRQVRSPLLSIQYDIDEVFDNFSEMKFLFVSDQLLHHGIRLVKLRKYLLYCYFDEVFYYPEFQMMARGN